MLSSQRSAPSTGDETLDRIFHALGNRTRRRLLARLTNGPTRVTDLAAPFDMSLPAIGKHVRVLEKAGLVHRSVEGRVHRCTLNAEPLRDADAWLLHYRQYWDDTLDSLVAYLQPGSVDGEKP